MLDSIFNPIFFPVLRLHPFLAITIISLVLSLLMTIAYKYLTDQNLMKTMKEEIKELQNEMKTLKDNPKQMMAVQKKAMETNMKYFMQSLKPTLITFIPIILIFSWLNAHMGYLPIVKDTEFSVAFAFDDSSGIVQYLGGDNSSSNTSLLLLNSDNQTVLDKSAKFVYNGQVGDYTLRYKYKDKEYKQQVIIVENIKDRTYALPEQKVGKEGLLSITTNNEMIKPHKDIFILGWIPWIKNFGWLGSYVLLSIAFSLILRKVMNVY
ncbi:DUF106 domain-containing protein [Candidatus Woesearchaeota archaeon]|nr:DUF106 domain-containing protein [Candidatus Woesearchaeota archaeon]